VIIHSMIICDKLEILQLVMTVILQ